MSYDLNNKTYFDNEMVFDEECLLTPFEDSYINLYFIVIKVVYLLNRFDLLDELFDQDATCESMSFVSVRDMLDCSSYIGRNRNKEVYFIYLHYLAHFKCPYIKDEIWKNPDEKDFNLYWGYGFTETNELSYEYCILHGLDYNEEPDKELRENLIFIKASKPVMAYLRKCYKEVYKNDKGYSGYSDESFLAEMGYSINVLTIDRHKILSKAIEKYDSGYVIKFLYSLINSRKAQEGGSDKYMNAISIWEGDIRWIKRQENSE
jgi:hypothetical protein